MRRQSLQLKEEDWATLIDVAQRLGCYWSGKPSWRRLVRGIASGKVRCRGGWRETELRHQEERRLRRCARQRAAEEDVGRMMSEVAGVDGMPRYNQATGKMEYPATWSAERIAKADAFWKPVLCGTTA